MKKPHFWDKAAELCFHTPVIANLPIAAKLILPFIVAVVILALAMGGTCCASMTEALNRSLMTKSRTLTNNLLGMIADPVAMGDWDHVQKIFHSAQLSDADVRYIILISNDGQVQASTNPKVPRSSNIPKSTFDPLSIKSYTAVPTENSEVVESRAPVQTESSQIAALRVGISRRRVDDLIFTTQSRVILIGLAGLLGGILFYLVAIRGLILEPIGGLVSVARRLARGDLVESVKVYGNDEIGALSQSMSDLASYFSEMADVASAIARGNLQATVASRSQTDAFGNAFQQMVESLKNVLQRLAFSAKSLDETASELAISSTQQSAIISQQYEYFSTWLNTLDDMRKTVVETSASASSVVGISEQSLDVSNKGLEALDEASRSMIKIRDQVSQVNQNILELSTSASKIGEITMLVEEIASLSEILTVNGVIEAVRAGEAGRGFHVVAKEVKNLSLRSKDATAQVRAVLAHIEQSTASTFQVVEQGNARVENGVTQIHRVGSNFQNLYATLLKTVAASKNIAKAAERQVEQIGEIIQAMKDFAAAAGQSAVAAKEQNDTAQDLSEMAASIKVIVDQYALSQPYTGLSGERHPGQTVDQTVHDFSVSAAEIQPPP